MTRAARATSTTGNAARRSARPAATVVAALLTVGLLSACSGAETPQEDPGPTTTAPSEETSASPTPSATEDGVEKPERPAAMDKKNADGAAAAVEYFLTLETYMLSTGDTKDYKAMSFKTCGYCSSVLENQQWLEDTDSTYTGGTNSIEVLQQYKRDEALGIFPLDVRLRTEAITILDSAGKQVDHSKAGTTDLRAEVALKGNSWKIVGLPAAPKS